MSDGYVEVYFRKGCDEMKLWKRRSILSFVVFGSLIGCANSSLNPLSKDPSEALDARVLQTIDRMHDQFPTTKELSEKAAGVLVIPVITEAGLGYGGGYGRGALLIGSEIVDYYSVTSGTVGLQIGAQQYSNALFFMTTEALENFRASAGWNAGGKVEFATLQEGMNVRADTATALADVVTHTFGQSGVKFGAVLEGAKYTRIAP